ncbi:MULTISPECIES: AAA family ATPase [unclassified Rhodococcus (in: high G+C Gram-positive bacteria)]|uniref:AAA family ATPase n=1 Tax=unclassified Rhodococcus (in: high G+C Gram-positive bacteria) TaxID=192944 RepID=UPI001C9B4604|nr:MULTISPECIES: AAA family ATPase [unclassified Rhodococcus (in: high G+C Gram-positive bacteria)]
MLLPSIGANRDDSREAGYAGLPVHEINGKLPPCVEERATFLSPHEVTVHKTHPYRWNKALKGISDDWLSLPAWSVHATPYYWMMSANSDDIARTEPLEGYVAELEAGANAALGFNPKNQTWVLHGDNQKALIETFFRNVTPQQSLVFFYLRHSPFEDAGRLLIGAASVDSLQLPGRWPTESPTDFPNHMWETTIRHTLRPDGAGGILLPMQALAALAAKGADVSSALAAAPQKEREFSYVTEHVADDAAVASLMALRAAADAATELGCAVPPDSIGWLDDQLHTAWRRRGVATGLPAVLGRLGFEYPTYAARLITASTAEGDDPWDTLTSGLDGNPPAGPSSVLFTVTRQRVWRALTDEDRAALRLLVRFDLSHDQITAVLDGETSVAIESEELLENPYHLVTCTVDDDDPIDFDIVDRGCFGAPELLAAHPLPVTEPFDDPGDPRRVEALIASELSVAAGEGHTLLPLPALLARVADRNLVRPLPLSAQVLTGLDLHPESLDDDPDNNWPVIANTRLADGSAAYKLRSLLAVRTTIRDLTGQLSGQPRHRVPDDLATALDTMLGDLSAHDPHDLDQERRAREEKTEALAEMYTSRFTILNGPAGTGKTTLVKALVQRPEIQSGGVLLLAPTGKARVQLAKKVGHDAVTVAQFLARSDRFDGSTGRYTATSDPATRQKFGLVVVDEASLLTETMLAALIDALHPPQRLILVGDPRQLPPIGEGRPFVDLDRAARAAHDGGWPEVAPGWAGLTVLRRQQGRVRDDLMLAKWFAGDEIPEGFDEVWERMRLGQHMESLRSVHWAGRSPEQVLEKVLAEELGVRSDDDGRSFAASYGATVAEYVNYYDAPGHIEDWQVLSPLRNHAAGTIRLNRHLKELYRGFELRQAQKWDRDRKVPKPLGPERIVMGDKVVNLTNRKYAQFWSRDEGAGRDYLANGEIGVVVGQIKSRNMSKAPWQTDVEYSSQRGRRFRTTMEGSETDAPVELAWALTVHKSQGSEFGLVIVMLPASAGRVSRELIYTALTRQTRRVVLCHEGPIEDLLELTRATGSDTGRRMTDLTIAPDPVSVSTLTPGAPSTFLDAGLVHVTRSGILVRSKNEVIVAGILDDIAPGSWIYEQPLIAPDGSRKVPDFTITTADGQNVYWEHLGKLDVPEYAAAWERKRAWYAAYGITEEGGPGGTLFTTDDLGGVDIPQWRERAESVIGEMRRPAPKRGAVKRAAPKKR